MNDGKRRVVIGLYRSMVRWSSEVGGESICLESIRPDDLTMNMNINQQDFQKGLTLNQTLLQAIRSGFRKDVSNETERHERIGRGLETLREMNKIKDRIRFVRSRNNVGSSSVSTGTPSVPVKELTLSEDDDISNEEGEKTVPYSATLNSTLDDENWNQELIHQISWLPAISLSSNSTTLSSDTSLVDGSQPDSLPLFPLTSTMYDPLASILPLFTQIQDVPLPGAEIPLKIFEPRYRQMYDDIITSGTKKFVVPFAHPTIPTKYASFGLLHEIINIQEVADQTNGTIQYMCHHIVTKPVCIQRILNPQVWSTRETYLKVQGTVENDDFLSDIDLKPLQDALLEWKNEDGKTRGAIEAALNAMKMEGLWGFVNSWIRYCQQELLDMQVGIAAEAQTRIRSVSSITQPDLEIVSDIQKPHRQRLLFLTHNIALLPPILLQSDKEGKCNHLMTLIQIEREHQRSLRLEDKTTR